MRTSRVLVPFLFLVAGNVAADAQTLVRRTVRIAIVDDYPAFARDVAVRHPGARPVAAILHRIQPDRGEGPSIVLLNPRYATPATVAAALERLATCPRGRVPDLEPVAPGAQVHGGAGALPAAREILHRVESAGRGQITDLPVFHGRSVDVPDLPVCRPPLGPRRSGEDP